MTCDIVSVFKEKSERIRTFVRCTCMAINNVSVSNNSGLLPDILLFVDPSAYFCMVRWQYYIIPALLTIYYSFFCFVMFGGSAWRLI